MGQAYRTSCAGSGVPGDIFEFGHSIVPGTEHDLFPGNRNGGGSYNFRRRCHRCASHRRYWLRQDCTIKASQTYRVHRRDMVKKKFAANEAEAERLMQNNGVTRTFIAEMFRPMIGKPCPGWCGDLEVGTGGNRSWRRHVFTSYDDLWFDWRDPDVILSAENCGPLCATCQKQKGPNGWTRFMGRQHAIRHNLLHGEAFRPAPTLFDLPENQDIPVLGPIPTPPPPPGQQLGFF